MSGQEAAAGLFPELKGFKILQELARSPKGLIYKARRLVEQDIVAVKIFRPSLCERKFVTELPGNAEKMFLIEHKGLVRSLGCVKEDSSLLLMMEFAPGLPLSQALSSKVPFQPSRVLRIILHCAIALRFAAMFQRHHGRLHPADIIVADDDARIIGVGMGERPEHAAWSVRDPYLFEPLIYTPPEAMPSLPFPETAGGRAAVDIYALGGILYHLLTGVPPFQGTDEGALETERKKLGNSIWWPKDFKTRLPAAAIALTEKMLSPDPAQRKNYDELVNALTAALAAAEKAEGRQPARTPASPSLPEAPASSGIPAPAAPAAAQPATFPAATPVIRPATSTYSSPEVAQLSLLTRLYTTFLVGMTALVFVVAIGLAGKIFLYDPLKQPAQAYNVPMQSQPPAQAATPAAQVSVPNTTPAIPAAPAQPQAAKPDEYATATRQLELIHEMLARHEIKHSAALLRLARTISERAGRDTPTGVKAIVLAAEIEEALLRESGVKPDVQKPVASVEPPPLLIPGVGKTSSAPPGPPEKASEAIPPPAEPKPADVAAKTTPPAPPVSNEPAIAIPAPQDVAKIAAALKDVMAKVKGFQYQEMHTELGKLSAGARPEEKKITDAYGELVRQELELFKRCRTRLLEQIASNPRRESPLQVFPRKNDPTGDDIIDFDEKGLKISAKRGPNAGIRVQPWDKVPPLQAYMLLQLLADRNSADDHIGLAAFAFSRGLKDQADSALTAASATPDAKDRADAMAESMKLIDAALEGQK